jgi:predicted AAA+ superfamily ATPase
MEYTINNFTAARNIVIVQPGNFKELTVKNTVPDKEKNKGKKPEEVHEMKEIEEQIRCAYRVGTILSINNNDAESFGFKIGDNVAYIDKNAVKFDLLAKNGNDQECPVIIMPYNIVAIVNK